MALKVLKPLKNGGWARRKVSAKKKGKAKRFDTPAVSNLHPVIALTLHLLSMGGLPYALMSLVHAVACNMSSPMTAISVAEFFAGCKSICNGFRQHGMTAVSFEIEDRAIEDMLSGIGFAYAISLVLRLRRTAGLCWLAPVCSTWVWINRSTSGRSRERPLGAVHLAQVANANCMVSRCCILALVCCILRIPFILEQPASSLMQFHPDFQYLCRKFEIYRVFVWLGSYGGSSPKGTFLYSNYQWITSLYLPLPSDADWPADMSKRYVDSKGVNRVCGGADLKGSQHYPALLGQAVAQLYLNNHKSMKKIIKQREEELSSLPKPMKAMRESGWASSANLIQALKVQQKSKGGLVTPNKPSSNSSRSSTPVTPKKLSFAERSSIHHIQAENPPGKGFEDETMKGEKADAIIAAMRKDTAAKEQRKKKAAAAAANSSSSDEEHEAQKAKGSKESDVKVKSKKEQKGKTLKQSDDDEEPRKRKGDAGRKTGPRKAQKQEPKEKSEKPKESKKRKEEKEKEEARQKEEEEREAAAKMKAAKEESEKEHRGNAKSKAKKAKAEQKAKAEKAQAEKAKAEQKAKEDAEKAAKEIAKKEKEQKAQAEKAMKAKAEKEKETLALEDAKNMKPVSLLKKKEATESEDEEEDSNSNDSEGSSEGESEEEASQLESDSDHEEESQEKSSDNEEVSEEGSEDEDQEEEEEEEGSVSESSQGETNSEGEDSDGKGEMGSEEESEKETKVDTGVKRKLCEEEAKAPSEATEKTKGEKKREKKEAKKEAKKALKDAEKSLAKKGIKVKNSTKFRKEWQAFTRYLKNPTRCPAKVIAACKNKETRHQLFQDYVETNRDTAQVEARFEARLEETQRTIPDPEFPGEEDEKLFFVMVELNMDDIRELRRVTQIEMQGSLDADGVKAFVEAGGC
ncbi:unnamed protein product [Cladocopium goreaui]|uniref:Uncharacterized protein n=1 Tax=Cladocopium goreaui TaxID=2562237 RepID=A0A9P1FLQ3_9DINO|nr:unnamed protein product [Cladocopium goreaui]